MVREEHATNKNQIVTGNLPEKDQMPFCSKVPRKLENRICWLTKRLKIFFNGEKVSF